MEQWIENRNEIPLSSGDCFKQVSGYICGISVIVTQCGDNDYSVWDSANEKPVIVYAESIDQAADEAFQLTLDTMQVYLNKQI